MADAVHEITHAEARRDASPRAPVGRWLKEVGEPVAFDDPLFEVSTDKVDSEIPSPYDGVLLEVLVQPGDTVPVGTPLARIGPAGRRRCRASRPRSRSRSRRRAERAGRAARGDDAQARRDASPRAPSAAGSRRVGDPVAFDDPLFEVSTDKVDSEIPSPYDGVLLEILVPEGRDRAGRHRRWPASAHPGRRRPRRAAQPAGTGRRSGHRRRRSGAVGTRAVRQRRRHGRCPPSSGGWPPSTTSTWRRSPAPAPAGGSCARTCSAAVRARRRPCHRCGTRAAAAARHPPRPRAPAQAAAAPAAPATARRSCRCPGSG